MRRSGIITITLNGDQLDAKGNFEYNLGRNMREGIVLADGAMAGYKETGQVPFIAGEIIDRGDLDLNALLTMENATVSLQLGNDKSIALRNAWFAGEGSGNTEDGNIAVRFEGLSADEY